MKKPICKILRTNKKNNFKFPIKFLMTLDKSYIGYLGFLGIDFLKSVVMYSKRAICLSRLLFKMGLFTVYAYAQSNFKECSPFKTYATGPDAYREHPGQEHDAFAEHTQQELTRTLSIHISFFCVCSAKA
jgi:hypothetical protein